MKKLARPLLFIAAWLLLTVMSKNYNQFHMHRVVQWDAEGYYMYLPAVFVYNGFEKVPGGQFTPYPGTNKIFVKFTCGVAMLELPFFLAAHAYTLISKDYAPDGYTFYYLLSAIAAAAFYSLMGLFLLYPVLRKHFSIPVSIFTLALIFFGTNLYFYTIGAPAMSHVYSFFLLSLLVYLTPRILDHANYPMWMVYGLVVGLLTLIRPTNGLAILYPLLYGIFSYRELQRRIEYFFWHYRQIIVAAIAAFLTTIPQLLYWKYLTGHYVFDSYDHEGFTNWLHPYILQVLFDPQNGWLLYTPIMLFALIGVIIAFKKREPGMVPVPFILVLATYLFASWHMWWFGGNFGHRCYVEYYAILAVPFGYFLDFVVRQKWMITILLFAPLLVCTYFNLELMYHFNPPWNGDWDWTQYWGTVRDIF